MPIIITPSPYVPPTPPTPIAYRDWGLDVRYHHAVYDNLIESYLNRRVQGDSFYIPKCRFVSSVGKGARNVHHHAALERQISNGVYTEERGTWLLPKIYIPENVIPLVGDTVSGVGYEWTILIVNRPLHNSCWTLSCNRLFFNLPLTTTINYYSVEVSKDSYGGRIINKELTDDELVCAFQPITQDEEIKNNRIYFNTEYFVYLPQDFRARIGDVIENDETKKLFKIININNRLRLDEYTTLTVKEIINENEI